MDHAQIWMLLCALSNLQNYNNMLNSLLHNWKLFCETDHLRRLWLDAQNPAPIASILPAQEVPVLNSWLQQARAKNIDNARSHVTSPNAYVPVGAILSTKHELYTSGLVTSTALAITDGTTSLMAHVSARTEVKELLLRIKRSFPEQMKRIEQGHDDINLSIFIWSGSHRFKELSQHRVMRVLSELKLNKYLIDLTLIDKIDEYSIVGINRHGCYYRAVIPTPWHDPNGIVVRQSTAVANINELVSDKLRGFAVLAFRYHNLNFMSVIDDSTFLTDIESVIRANFNISELQNDDLFKLNYWVGRSSKLNWYGEDVYLSKITIIELAKILGLESKLVDRSADIYDERCEVGINKNGVFCKIPDYELPCSEKLKLHGTW